MLDIRLWDIGAALSVRVITPAGQNHIIDAGASSAFSPAEHIAENYWNDGDRLDYLVISHFDADHCRDLPRIIDLLGPPRVYLRNKSVPDDARYGSLQNDYQRRLQALDQSHTHPVSNEHLPTNPTFNGGVDIISGYLNWDDAARNFNDASIVLSYLYAGVMLIYPGDIGPVGWAMLMQKKGPFLNRHLEAAEKRILVAPHHGRPSGYSKEMIDYIRPDAVIASDGYGAGETDRRFYNAGRGLRIDGETKSFISTKLNGRKLIKVSPDGSIFVQG